jgi:outer membrane protein assembly factor BamD (BamD/ComL family)
LNPGKNEYRGGPLAGIFVLVFFLLFSPPKALAQERGAVTIDETMQMALGDQFFQEADYGGAIREYKRFLFFFPQSVRGDEAMLKISQSHLRDEKWEEALSAADNLIRRYPTSSRIAEAQLIKGNVLAVKRQYPEARSFFRKAQDGSPQTALADEAQMQIARTYIREERWKEAASEFRRIDPNSRVYNRADTMARGLDRIDELPQDSPLAAGVLSGLLPGAGQIYTGRYGEGIIAFLLNGAFIWGMVESFSNKNYVGGGILTVFELGWYSANIVNAVNNANKNNKKRRADYLQTLEKEGGFSLAPALWGRTLGLRLQYAF